MELLAETLQRINQHNARLEKSQEELNSLRQEQQRQWTEQQSRWDEQIAVNRALLTKVQQHDQQSDNHAKDINALQERTEYIHQSALAQQKAYQDMSQLLLMHHQALPDKGLL